MNEEAKAVSLTAKLKKLAKTTYWAGFDLLHQRTHRSTGYNVHYLYRPGKTDDLVVVFSAFAAGLKPTYNYVRTLWGHTDAHLLFIRVDFVNLPSGGAYYIGNKGDSHGRNAVLSLIRHIREKSSAKRVIGVGSSKGGTAALLFGAMLPMDAVIIGAPQYYIGTYMREHKPDSLALLASSGGNVMDEDVAWLDNLVPRAIRACGKKPAVHIHYSDREHTYPEHIADMLRDLQTCGYEVREDVADYEKHTDVYKHYIPYLTRTLPILLNERSSPR